MKHGRWLPRLVIASLLAALGAGGSGCASCCRPLPAETAGPCAAVPAFARCHVHVFLMNGYDPIGPGDLSDLRDHINKLGFRQTYYGQLYHTGWFEREMLRLKCEDPEGHIVLIGYGRGARCLGALGQRLAGQGVPIDLLLAVNAAPEDVASGGAFPVYAMNASDWLPVQLQVAEELAGCAARVHVEEIDPPVPETGPTPRPAVPLKPQKLGSDWDSLKPVSHLD
jgi:hypothetical protein